MLNKLRKFSVSKGRRTTLVDITDDSLNMPLLTNLINEQLKHSVIETSIKELYLDIDNIRVDDVTVVEKIEKLVQTQQSKILWFLKNSKAGTDSFSMLHLAAKHYRYSACEILLEGVQLEINRLSKSLKTPLHVLVKSDTFRMDQDKQYEKRMVKCFHLFVSKSIDYNARDEFQKSALHYAVISKNLKAVELLCELRTLEISPFDTQNWTPLHYACQKGYTDIGMILIEKSDPEKLCQSTGYNSLPIHLACSQKEEHFEMVIAMLKKIKGHGKGFLQNLLTFKLNENQQSLLEIAIRNNHLKIIEAIIKDYYEDFDVPDANGLLPIHLAADNGSLAILEILKTHQAVRFSPNAKLDNPLHIAAAKNRFAFIDGFLKEEAIFLSDLDDEDKRIPGAKKKERAKQIIKTGVGLEPCIQQKNEKGLTPLFVALLMDNTKSVEALSNDSNCLCDSQDNEGNTIFHICSKYGNVESLRLLLKNKNFLETLFLKNQQLQTALHVAGNNGGIDSMKMIIEKFYDGSLDGREAFLLSKDNLGRTCFSNACHGGFFNIVEYLIKDLKLLFLAEEPDYNYNLPLHHAANNGHLSIVEILTLYDANVSAKNGDGVTSLELSCRKNFFEISKVLINGMREVAVADNPDDQSPLIMAAQEGAHEVVELLLHKGYPIDFITADNKNALDIALEYGHKDVVRVLLNNEEWKKLIQYERKKAKVKKKFQLDFKKMLSKSKTKEYNGENPQLHNMSRLKLWESYQQILDKSHDPETNKFDFSILDPPCESIKKHPLMLLAESGQETLLTHDTTQKLLLLKWRFIPRFLYYSNLAYLLLFMIIFGLYSVELTDLTFADNSYKATDLPNENIDDIWDEYTSFYHRPIMALVFLSSCKIIIQMILVDGLSFFFGDSVVELMSIVLTLICIFSQTLALKTQYASVALLALFTTFTFLIQKLQVIGVYVLAFKRTLVNSAKFLPVFLIVYVGFLLSFRVRVNADVSVFNSTGSTSFLQGITMMMGDFQTSQMGVEKSILNYVLYVAFISIMSVIILNLFVGIAVGEIKQTLDEADIQQISMRIQFVLQIQDALRFTKQIKYLDAFFDMRYESYSYEENEPKIMKSFDRTYEFITTKFSNGSTAIDLVDPQTRLEEAISELANSTENEFKVVKETLSNQMIAINDQLNNSKTRLEDCLSEMSRKTVSNFENSADGSTAALDALEIKLISSQSDIKNQLLHLDRFVAKKFQATKFSFFAKLTKSDDLNLTYFNSIISKLNSMLSIDLKLIASNTNTIQLDTLQQFKIVKEILDDVNGKMVKFQNDLDVVNEKLTKTQNQIMQSDYKLNAIETMNRREGFSSKLDNTNKKLDALKEQEDQIAAQVQRIKKIDQSLDVVDDKLNKCMEQSEKLDQTLANLDKLFSKTAQLEPEINRIKLIEDALCSADNKLDKALDEQSKLDTTLEKLERLNIKMSIIEPELAKLEDIEATMQSFDEKQTKLITVLLDVINKKKSREESVQQMAESSRPTPQTAAASVESGPPVGLRERIRKYDELRYGTGGKGAKGSKK